MPDWFYRTVARPLLFRLPAVTARDLSLGFMGLLARLPLGAAVIDFLGHMRPDERLKRSFLGVTFPSAVGLGAGLDGNAVALPALARFGFGFLEVGPITLEPLHVNPAVERHPEQQAVWYADPPANPGLVALTERLRRDGPLRVPLLVRLGFASGISAEQAGEACRQMVVRLGPYADLFALTTANQAIEEGWSAERWQGHLETVLQAVRQVSPPRPLLLCIPTDLDLAKGDVLIGPALSAGVGGVIVDDCVRAAPAGRLAGPPAGERARQQVRHLRERWGEKVVVIGGGGVHEPEQALQLVEAGANLVRIDTGLVYAGPGLPKRINDALLFAGLHQPPTAVDAPRSAEMSWFWIALLGVSMIVGGILALAIAATRVVLPYDEVFTGLTRAQLQAANPRLLLFMTHDRVSLAGTMIAVGVLYLGLSRWGMRRGLHWARVSVLVSAFSGFGSFFLFLGFGYFDPFHAFVTAVLFQFLLLGLHAGQGQPSEGMPPNLREDWCWRWSLWGQFLFIVHGCVLIGAGLVIASIGITTVFVPEDLEFMQTTPEALAAVSPHLLPLVAHDRASFGGMLVASGLAVLLPALWGYRQGSRWLWWTLLAAGTPAYAAAIGVHLAVGYTNFRHLLPAFAGAVMFVMALGLSYPYLCGKRRGGSRQSVSRQEPGNKGTERE